MAVEVSADPTYNDSVPASSVVQSVFSEDLTGVLSDGDAEQPSTTSTKRFSAMRRFKREFFSRRKKSTDDLPVLTICRHRSSTARSSNDGETGGQHTSGSASPCSGTGDGAVIPSGGLAIPSGGLAIPSGGSASPSRGSGISAHVHSGFPSAVTDTAPGMRSSLPSQQEQEPRSTGDPKPTLTFNLLSPEVLKADKRRSQISDSRSRGSDDPPHISVESTHMIRWSKGMGAVCGFESQAAGDAEVCMGPEFDPAVAAYYKNSDHWSDGLGACCDGPWEAITCCCIPCWFVRLYQSLLRAAPLEIDCRCMQFRVVNAGSAARVVIAVTLLIPFLGLGAVIWGLALYAIGRKYNVSLTRLGRSFGEFCCLKGGCCLCAMNIRAGVHVDRAQGFKHPTRPVRDLVSLGATLQSTGIATELFNQIKPVAQPLLGGPSSVQQMSVDASQAIEHTV
eukprot:TRINITY_DN12504_c0_g1_i1.p1 TRINITY_DN12504_c0_g1~~TRINITY_DN12504_c0_g1_i1.p1  ORF type:complete len:478 (-),score=26.19 TRINITY_DN12504_c0_g1_i1:94-1443(-)